MNSEEILTKQNSSCVWGGGGVSLSHSPARATAAHHRRLDSTSRRFTDRGANRNLRKTENSRKPMCASKKQNREIFSEIRREVDRSKDLERCYMIATRFLLAKQPDCPASRWSFSHHSLPPLYSSCDGWTCNSFISANGPETRKL